MKSIYLAATQKHISISTYVNAWKVVKSQPLDTEYKHGLSTWWAQTGAEILKDYRAAVHDRINQRVNNLDMRPVHPRDAAARHHGFLIAA